MLGPPWKQSSEHRWRADESFLKLTLRQSQSVGGDSGGDGGRGHCLCAAILLHVLSVDGAFSLSHSLTCWPLWPEKKLLLLQMALLVAVPSSKNSRPSSRLTSQVGP